MELAWETDWFPFDRLALTADQVDDHIKEKLELEELTKVKFSQYSKSTRDLAGGDSEDEIAIVYDPWDPRDAVRAGRPENRMIAIAAAAGSAVMLSVAVGAGVGAGLIHRGRRR